MTRLFSPLSTQQNLRSSLAALSTPRQYLEFALKHKLSAEQRQEVAVSFLSKFGQYAQRPFSFISLTHEELISLLAQTANNYERG